MSLLQAGAFRGAEVHADSYIGKDDVVLIIPVPSDQLELATYIKMMCEQLGRMFETMFTQNPKYGFSWRDDGLGARSMFSNATAKQFRLKQLVWETPEKDWDLAKILETYRDRVNYDLFAMTKIVLEHGDKISEAAIKAEVDKT